MCVDDYVYHRLHVFVYLFKSINGSILLKARQLSDTIFPLFGDNESICKMVLHAHMYTKQKL